MSLTKKIAGLIFSLVIVVFAAPSAFAFVTGDSISTVHFTCTAQNIHRVGSSHGATSGKWFPGHCGTSVTFEHQATHEKVHRFVGCTLVDQGDKASCSGTFDHQALGIDGLYQFSGYHAGTLPESSPEYGGWRNYINFEGPEVTYTATALGNVFNYYIDVKHIKVTPY
jgi:hypothetical protein